MNSNASLEPALQPPESGTTTLRRRALVAAGASAWIAPSMMLAAPVAHAGISQCTVSGSIQAGPNVTNTMRAICTAQSQYLDPGTLEANYGVAVLPAYLEICNCQQQAAWYRWRETDTLSEFQIEVDGVHVDQNSSAAGWRSSFWLPSFGNEGGCKRFALTYRTSVPRPTTNTNVTITFELQRSTSSATGPWTNVTTISVSGTVRRTVNPDPVNFNVCSAGGTQARTSSGRGD